ncbi:VWA domain-containing protein [Oscillochloris sp. ZM17-4]|uniref:VWA domain-containing protein n=1 Tax=Oscillochloris sp. ZM17-4 TaxID=2866714 RepID=UPI001C73CC9B|nr:VWA domain-containing protein [Oscillochloris sp. ZM17-4]MBX0329174.1 VWA domain-containing protein [Oscillochloris sp. ZM17-4]
MDWLWPTSLFLLAIVPLAIGAYIWALRWRRYAVRYSSLSLLREALAGQSQLRRHMPFGLMLCGVGSLVLALGRPVAVVSVPTGQTTILLSIDVSRSMCSTDIAPSRLEAAEAAALSFIDSQRPGTQIGVVAFAGLAEMVQAPTDDRDALNAAITSLLTGRRTAIGSGILSALDAIAEIDPSVAPSTDERLGDVPPTPVPQGAYAPSIIVLLTDGASNAGPQPVDAAQQAADRGVRVYTIGFGTPNGSALPPCGRQFIGNEPGGFGGGFGGGGGGGGGGFRRGIDEETLKQVSAITGGEYYAAESASELQRVFAGLPVALITRHEAIEISVIFTAVGALLAGLAVALAMLWRPLG